MSSSKTPEQIKCCLWLVRGTPPVKAIILSLCIATWVALSGSHVLSADANTSDATATDESEPAQIHLVSWFNSLDAAKQQARVRRAPILVKAGAEWCDYCQQLDQAIENPGVQQELERWLPVEIDVDQQARVARELAIGPIPALRVLTPDGRVVAAHDGFLPADELATWLEEHHEAAALPLEANLSKAAPPTAIAVVRVLKEFNRRDATLRDAAITRLVPYPEATAAQVLKKFNTGTLSERLTALELLQRWNAPIDGLDPWQPNSFSDDRLAKLDEWLKEQNFTSPAEGGLTSVQTVEAERLIRMMLTTDAAATASMREQLARMGTGVLPLLRDALQNVSDDEARARLTAARYRLVASNELVLKWSGGIEQLASQDFEERIEAVSQLANIATSHDEELLLAIFSDPAPLIRELALRALKQTSGEQANSALVRLFDDPEPNIRAAVLKELAESPTSQLVPKIAAYARQEHDPDLIVHAIRFLREVKEATAVAALLGMFEHPSWRVRAESADGVARLLKDHDLKSKVDQTAVQTALIGLLDDEDAFVVSRAATGLEATTTKKAVEPLTTAAQTHPELAPEIIRVLVSNSLYRSNALPFLQRACQHELASVRAAAVTGLVEYKQGKALPQLEEALQDTTASVRTAALDAVFGQLAEEIDSLRDADQVTSSIRIRSSSSVVQSQPGILESLFGGLLGGGSKERVEEEPEPELTDGAEDVDEPTQSEDSLQRIRDKRQLSKWLYESEPLLLPLLNAEEVEERTSAARALALLGQADALPILMTAAEQPDLTEKVIACLPRLTWEERQALFQHLTASTDAVSSLILAAQSVVQASDARTPGLLWELLARPDVDRRMSRELLQPFLGAYFSEEIYNLEETPPREIKRCASDCTRYADEGTPWQRVTALLVLLNVDRESVIPLAESVFTDEELPLDVREVALNVLLFCEKETDALDRSTRLLDAEEQAFAETGLVYATLQNDGLMDVLGDSARYVSWRGHSYETSESGPIVPEAPEGISLPQLDRFLDHSELAVRAQAGYLRALLGDFQSLDDVIAAWEAAPHNELARRLAYGAISRVNDPATVPVLEQIYTQLKNDPYAQNEVKQLYWTIRTMTGPEILGLRKQIRTDYGADALR